MCSHHFCERSATVLARHESACVIQPIFDSVAEPLGMKRRFGDRWTRNFLRCVGLKYRATSSGTKKTTDSKLLDTHVRDGVRSAPILHHQYGRDGREALGPGTPWLGETKAGHLTISTVVT